MQTLQTASTWDSFKNALYKVLETLNPKTVFEYGPGTSTAIMALYPSVEFIDSVEHNLAWYNKYKWEMPENVKISYQPNLELYPETPGRIEKYDLIFVDGREREKCLYVAPTRLNDEGVVILHDAERPNYQEAMRFYKFMFLQDDGHTAILCNNNHVALKLSGVFQ